MGTEHIKFDIHHWNLDWFKPARPKAPGKESLSIVFNDGRGPLKRVALLEYKGGGAEAFLLRSKARAVDKMDPRSSKAPAVFKDVSNREIVDIAVHGRDLYLLDRKNQRIECFPYDAEEDEPTPRDEPKSKKDKRKQRQEERKQRKEEPKPRFWTVSDAELTPNSRMVLVPGERAGDAPPAAYVGGTRSGRLFYVTLGDAPQLQEVEVRLPSGPETLGHEIYMCLDPLRRTLLVSDTAHHRILEIDPEGGNLEIDPGTGNAVLLCGTGQPGTPTEGEPAAHAAISSPRALALYRHSKEIAEELIEKDMRGIFSCDEKRVRPRTILFVDSGSSAVRKIVDFPKNAETLYGIPAGPLVYTLLGGPQGPPGGLLRNRKTDDLREVPVKQPVDLAVLVKGELVVASENPPSLLVLRPATSQGEERMQTTSRALNLTYDS